MKMTRTDLCGSWIMIIWKIWPPCSRKSMVSWAEFLFIIKSWSPLVTTPGIILCMGSASEKRRYIVTPPLIGWAHTQQDACIQLKFSLKYLLILSTAQGFVRSRALKICWFHPSEAMEVSLFMMLWMQFSLCLQPVRRSWVGTTPGLNSTPMTLQSMNSSAVTAPTR